MAMQQGLVVRDQGGRIAGVQGLTAQQSLFVTSVVANGGDAAAAAKTANYQSWRTEGYRLRQLPHVVAAIHAAQTRELADLANASLAVIRHILTHKPVEGEEPIGLKIKLDAAKTVLDRAGHVAPKAAEPVDPRQKAPDEMTLAELGETLERIRKQVAEAEAGMADITPTGPVIDQPSAPIECPVDPNVLITNR